MMFCRSLIWMRRHLKTADTEGILFPRCTYITSLCLIWPECHHSGETGSQSTFVSWIRIRVFLTLVRWSFRPYFLSKFTFIAYKVSFFRVYVHCKMLGFMLYFPWRKVTDFRLHIPIAENNTTKITFLSINQFTYSGAMT